MDPGQCVSGQFQLSKFPAFQFLDAIAGGRHRPPLDKAGVVCLLYPVESRQVPVAVVGADGESSVRVLSDSLPILQERRLHRKPMLPVRLVLEWGNVLQVATSRFRPEVSSVSSAKASNHQGPRSGSRGAVLLRRLRGWTARHIKNLLSPQRAKSVYKGLVISQRPHVGDGTV
jgi:hypothetical protein